MRFIKTHIEWFVFAVGLLLLALMDPSTAGPSFCLFDLAGIESCPGQGLGHSISYTFRGEFNSAFEAHFAGPLAVVVIIFRILHIWQQLIFNNTNTTKDKQWQK